MTILVEHKRVKAGQELDGLRSSALTAFQNLDSVKLGLQALKTELQGDADFLVTDIAQIDAGIAFVNSKYTP